VRETLSVTDRAYIVQSGKVLAAGRPADLSSNSEAAECISAIIYG